MTRHHSYLSALDGHEDVRQRSPKEPFKIVVQDDLIGFCDQAVCCIQLLRPNLKDSYIFNDSKETAHVHTGWLKLSG